MLPKRFDEIRENNDERCGKDGKCDRYCNNGSAFLSASGGESLIVKVATVTRQIGRKIKPYRGKDETSLLYTHFIL